MENIETKDIEVKETDIENEKDAKMKDEKADAPEADEVETESAVDELFTKIAVNQLTQNPDISQVLYKILTLCSLSKTVDNKIFAWVKFLETITKQEFEELSKIQKNFDFQLANRDFRNDAKLKGDFARQEGAKMTKKLTSLINVPMIDRALVQSQIHLSDAELNLLAPFYFPATVADKVVEAAKA